MEKILASRVTQKNTDIFIPIDPNDLQSKVLTPKSNRLHRS